MASEGTAEQRQYRHHRLEQLASFVPELTEKDKAILGLLAHYLTWAGRYPDPGSGREQAAEDIFVLSEKHQITARDVIGLAARIMNHTVIEIRAAS